MKNSKEILEKYLFTYSKPWSWQKKIFYTFLIGASLFLLYQYGNMASGYFNFGGNEIESKENKDGKTKSDKTFPLFKIQMENLDENFEITFSKNMDVRLSDVRVINYY